MKKLSITAICVSISIGIFAQVGIGVKAGVSNNKVSINDNIDGLVPQIKGMTGFTVGLFTEVPLNDKLSFRPELNYSRKGFSMREGTGVELLGQNLPIGASVVSNINYIETPLLLQYNVGNERASIYGIGGLSLSYASSGYLQPKATVFLEWNLPRVDINFKDDMYNRFSSNAIIGIGGKLAAGRGRFNIDLRYEHGINDQINFSIIDTGVKNRSIVSSIGYTVYF